MPKYDRSDDRRREAGYAVMYRLVFAAIIAAVWVAAVRMPASAAFTVCNKTTDTVKVATAADWYDYYDTFPNASFNNYTPVVKQQTDYFVQGWATIPAGECYITLNADLIDLTIHFYAFETSNPTHAWRGKYQRCVDLKHDFAYGNSLADHSDEMLKLLNGCGTTPISVCTTELPIHPEAPGANSARVPCTAGSAVSMMYIDTGSGADWKVNLTP